MFDIGWSEMAVIALVALVVVGPKQLPHAMRSFAQFSKKMRRYAQEFRSGVDNIIREAELEDAKKALDTVRSANPKAQIKKWVDPTGEMSDEIASVEKEAKGEDGKAATAPGEKKAIEKKALPDATGDVDPTGPATSPTPEKKTPAAPAVASESTEPAEQVKGGDELASASEPAAKGARRVSQPLQMAPPHSIRPPTTPPVETARPVETAATKTESAAAEPDGAESSEAGVPVAEEVRKKA